MGLNILCVCVCTCIVFEFVYLCICEDHFEHRPYGVGTFWPLLTLSQACLRVKTCF